MSPYVFAGNNPIRFIDVAGKNPEDVIKLSLSNLGKQRGYIVQFNKETQETVITKTEVTYNDRSNITENAVTFTLTETTIRLDKQGNITGAIVTESDVSAEVEKTTGFFSNVDYKLLKNEQGKTNNIKSGNTKSDPKGLLAEVKGDVIVKATQKVLNSANRNALSTGEGLPNLSNSDLLETIVPTAIKVIGAAFDLESFGLEDQIDFESSGFTTLKIPETEVGKAAFELGKVAKKTPVKEF